MEKITPEHSTLQAAIIRGFTRSDLLLLGDLIDVTEQASAHHFLVPVAASRAVEAQCHVIAYRLHTTVDGAMNLILRQASRAVSAMGEIGREETERITLGHGGEAFTVHVAQTAGRQVVVTIYAAGEDIAPC